MNNIKNFIKNNKICASGIIIGILSLIGNILSVMLLNQPHIYDIVHAIPTILVYNPIINAIGGRVPSELIFIPLAVIIDFIIGLIIGAIFKKFSKTESGYLWGIIISFLVYWIIITYQWLPIL